MESLGVIRTVAGAVTREGEKVKGSRFVADVLPVASEAVAALAVVGEVRVREVGATHHCWAFRLQDGRSRASDDGEPAGTAGAPMLRHLGGADLVDVVTVVTRYYGGTKLGTGGLIRAYGGAVASALSVAAVVVRPVVVAFAVDLPYELTGQVEGVLAAWSATVVDATYGVSVAMVVTVAEEVAEGFEAALPEATSGRVVPRRMVGRS